MAVNGLCAVMVALLVAAAVAQTCGGPKTCVNEGSSCFPTSTCDDADLNCDRMCPEGSVCILSLPDSVAECQKGTMDEVCNEFSCFSKANPLGDLYLDLTQLYQVCSLATLHCRPDDSNRIPNDFCTENNQCLAVQGASSGACDTTTGRCLGNNAGNSTCTQQEDCNVGFFCDQTLGQCTAQGTSCPNGFDNECSDLTTVCNAGECIPMFSLDFNQNCDNTLLCAEGLTCVGTCQDARDVSGLVGTNCTAIDGTADNTICQAPLVCECDSAKGNFACTLESSNALSPIACVSEFQKYVTCLVDNQCHRDSDPQLEDSCANRKCFGDWVNGMDCFFKTRSDALKGAGALDGSCSFLAASSSASSLEIALF